jgi:hypothetical protein
MIFKKKYILLNYLYKNKKFNIIFLLHIQLIYTLYMYLKSYIVIDFVSIPSP